MKLIAGVILSLAVLNVFHCAPLTSDGPFKEERKETQTSSSWGYNAGLNAGVGLGGKLKDGQGLLELNKHVGLDIGGHKENSQVDSNKGIPAGPAPYNYGQPSGYYSSPYTMPINPVNGLPYGVQYPSPYGPQWPQFAPQYTPQYGTQWAQSSPQYAYVPQYAPQAAPQNGPQYAPQAAPQYNPLAAPQYAPQNAPQYAPQNAPQYAPQAAPNYAPTKGTTDSSMFNKKGY